MGEFARFVTDYTKAKMPGVSVEHNYANAVAADSADIGSTELVNDACDYTGGDLYGDLYDHSFTAKYYRGVTRNPPFEYMTVRCDKKLSAHTVTKTEAALSLEVLLTAAHHGASLVIDAVDPVGTFLRRRGAGVAQEPAWGILRWTYRGKSGLSCPHACRRAPVR